MPTPRALLPTYLHFGRRDKGRIRYPGGKTRLLPGAYNSPESLAEFHRLVAEYNKAVAVSAAAAELAAAPPGTGPTVNDIILKFLTTRVPEHHDPDGREYDSYRLSLRPLREHYGTSPAKAFGPLALKRVRAAMVESGLARTTVNRRVNRIRTMWRWAESEELVPAGSTALLWTVQALGKNDKVREAAPRQAATREQLDALLPFLAPRLRAMLELQWWTGMRSAEVRTLRGRDIDLHGPSVDGATIWLYRPLKHKRSFDSKARPRVVALGLEAQRVLIPWLRDNPDEPLFQPREAELDRLAARTAARKSKETPSQRKRREERAKNRDRRFRATTYTRDAYCRRVAEGCARAIEAGKLDAAIQPYQLRHAAKQRAKAACGLDHARAFLGQSNPSTTEQYGDRDVLLAAEVARRIG